MAKTTVAIDLQAQTKGTESVKSLKTQIREATQEAVALAQKFGEFSPQAQAATARVAELKDQMEDFQQRVAALNPDVLSRIETISTGITRGIQAATGAMALFGSENEDVQKTLVRVQAAMALAEGVAGIVAMKSAFGALFTSVVAGFRAMAAAITTTGVGALIVAIGAAIGAVMIAMNRQSEAQKAAAKENEKLQQSLKDLEYQYQSLNRQIDYTETAIIGQMEQTGATEAEILKKRKEFVKERIDLARQEMNENDARYVKLSNNASKEISDVEDLKAAHKKIREDRSASYQKSLGEIENLQKQSLQLAFDIDKAEKAAAEKAKQEAEAAWKDYQSRLKAQADAERNSLQQLNEEKRKIREQDAKNETELLRVKYENDLARLKEARENELRADNLNAAAKANINAKFDMSELSAKQTFEAALTKLQKDAQQKRLEDAKAFEEQRKQITEQEIRETQANIDRVFKIRETDIYNRITDQTELNEALQKLETERLERQLREMKEYGTASAEQQIALENQIAKRKADIYKADAEAKKQENEAKMAAEIQLVQASAQAVGQLGQLFKQGSDAAKVAALTEIAVNTAIGFIQGLDIAQKGAKATGPAAPLAFPIFYASQIAAVLGAAGRAKQILKGGGGGGGGGGITPRPAPAPNTTPLTGGILPDMEQPGGFAGMGRVYVLEGDITKTQTRVRRVRNVSVV
jgi:hypothetical protein